MKLVLEVKMQADKTGKFMGGHVEVTPPIDEGYWLFRVKVGRRQAVVGFPKFGTIGIGFAVERDWNTNLPYTCTSEEIYQHIKHNKGDARIEDADCIRAIQMIKEAAANREAK